MKVIKLGGSLMADPKALSDCLNKIKQQNHDKFVIVPGGGVFANQVRSLQLQWQFDDTIAHEMAIIAMHQMALICKSLSPDFVLVTHVSNIVQIPNPCIWSPDIKELNSAGIKASWDVTSDSLAAWLANQLTADELILVKSAEIPEKSNIPRMQELGILDLAFAEFCRHASYKITLINTYRFNEYFSL